MGVVAVIALAASLLTTAPASASLQSQIAADQAQEQQLIAQLQSVQGQSAAAGQQAAALQQQINTLQQQLSTDQTELSQVNAELTATNNRLAATEAQMAKDRAQLAAMVSLLYQRDSGNNLASAIADSSGIAQFMDATLTMQTLRHQFDTLTQQLITDANTLKVLRNQQQAQEQQVATLVSNLQAQQNQLTAQENAYQQQESQLTGQAGAIAAQVQQLANQILLLQLEESGAGTGGPGGPSGTILHVCNGCYTGAYSNSFPFAQCTWFVATKTYVNWSGNAAEWIAGAAGAGTYQIGSAPQVNSIVVFRPGGAYDASFGHVAWVVAVSGSGFEVEEDNFVNEGSNFQDLRYVPSTAGVEGFIYAWPPA
ncbi:MAG: CHAP domain-containing protein [Candidatus Dormibacteria bacterium]